MKIDIDKLSEEELIDLNNRIVERLRLLTQMRAHSQMLESKSAIVSLFSPKGVRLCLECSLVTTGNGYRHHRRRTALEPVTRASAQGGVP